MLYLDALNIHVMPCGTIPPNPLEMISSKKFVTALELSLERFDRIVIDSAPVQPVSDALVLATYVNAIVYVFRADSTPATHAQRGIASLAGSNVPFIGAVLNQFDIARGGDYYHGEYYQNGSGTPGIATPRTA